MDDVKLIIDPVYTKIEGLKDFNVISLLYNELSYYAPSYKYSPKYKYGNWDGKHYLLSKQLKFPTGLLFRVQNVLNKCNTNYILEDNVKYLHALESLQWNGPALFPYQEKVVDHALFKKRGMIKACTGSGKTLMIAKLVANYNVPTMIYVVSLDLLSQMKETIESTLGIDVGVIGDGHCEIKKITICSVWTAGLVFGELKQVADEDIKVDKWAPDQFQKACIVSAIKEAKLCILDEAHFAAANSIRMILKNSLSSVYKYGFTATPWRNDGDDILLEAAFGEQICNITASELIREGYLVVPKIIFRDVPMYPKKLKKSWDIVKSTYIVKNRYRNDLLVQNAIKLLDMGRKPLLLFREIKHGQILADSFPADIRMKLVSGKLKKNVRDEIRQDFKDGKIDLIIASTVYDQGIDLKELDALILCGGGKSTSRALQRIGRVIRGSPDTNKKDAIVVDTFDQAHFVSQHSIARYNIYNTEEAFIIKVSDKMQHHIGG